MKLSDIPLPSGEPKNDDEFGKQLEGLQSFQVDLKIFTPPTLLRYQCATCGNGCLMETRPDNSVCGGCDNPDWKLMKFQESYMVNGEDWIHPDGEI